MKGFITGLPRSRTKWFADYFDGIDGVNAYHEPINGMTDKNQFYDLVDTGCVISDAGLFVTDFQERYSGIPTVIIERDPEAVVNSLRTLFGKENDSIVLQMIAFQILKMPLLQGLRVAFESINDRLEDIHDYLEIPFNREYADTMTGTNRQVSDMNFNPISYRLWA